MGHILPVQIPSTLCKNVLLQQFLISFPKFALDLTLKSLASDAWYEILIVTQEHVTEIWL